MTALRDKIGQLFMLGFDGTTVSKDLVGLIETYRPGGFIVFRRNLESAGQIIKLTNKLQKLAKDSPFLLAIDQEGGRVSRLPDGFTIFPPCAALGFASDSRLAYEAAAITATELKAVGINMNMAPVLDINTNTGNPIIGDRAFSTNPTTVCELGLATIAGLQDNKVVACGKHFPGHGDTTKDSHLELPVVASSFERVHDMELRPFRHAIENELATIMTAHVSYPKIDPQFPATLSYIILTDLLRNQLHFKGVIVTDDLEMRAIIDHYGIEEASLMAFQAGADMLLICKERERQVAALEAIYRAVKDGKISETRLEASLRRIARVKERFLLPYVPADLAAAKSIVGCHRHRTVFETVRQHDDRRLKATV